MKPKQIWDDTRGSALVEFTVTLPLFLLLMFGILQAGLLLYTQAGLQHGVEVAARCASVNYSANQIGLNQSCFTVGGVPTPSTVIATIRQLYQELCRAEFLGHQSVLTSTTYTVTEVQEQYVRHNTNRSRLPGYRKLSL